MGAHIRSVTGLTILLLLAGLGLTLQHYQYQLQQQFQNQIAAYQKGPACSVAAPCGGGEPQPPCGALFPTLASLVGTTEAAIRTAVSGKTMAPAARLQTNYVTIAYVIAARIPGELVEAGVAAGGAAASLFLAAAALGAPRGLHLYDTFAGMPLAVASVDSEKALAWTGRINHSVAEVGAFLADVGVPPGMTVFHVGDILATPAASLPCAISLFRLDTDWHASYVWALQRVLPRLSPGGVILLDDYNDWPGARKAVNDFLALPEHAAIGFSGSDPPMLCMPTAAGLQSPCGPDEFAVEIAAAAAAAAARRRSEVAGPPPPPPAA